MIRHAIANGLGRMGLWMALSSAAMACGGAPAPKSGESPSTVRALTQAQLKVAHYASGDGMVGLVLDRTGEQPKMQLDGEKDVMELTMEEERPNGGDRTGWFLRKPDGQRVLYIGVNGDMKVFTSKNRGGLALSSDRDAAPLPAATLKAKAQPAPAPGATTKLVPIAVRTHFADMTCSRYWSGSRW